MKRSCLTSIAWMFSLLVFMLFSATSYATIRLDEQAPKEVHLGFFVEHIYEIDEANSTIEVAGQLTSRWHPTKTTSSRLSNFDLLVDQQAQEELQDIWHPWYSVLNNLKQKKHESIVLKKLPNGDLVLEQRLKATLHTETGLHVFSISHQKIDLEFMPLGADNELTQWYPEKAYEGIGTTLNIPGWKLSGLLGSVGHYDKLETSTPVYRLSLSISRINEHYFFKILLPLILISFASYTAFWVGRDQKGLRVTVTFSTILIVVAFQLVTMRFLPEGITMNFVDYILFVCYSNAVITLIGVVLLSKNNCEVRERRLLSFFRWFLPIIYFGGIAGLISYHLINV